MKPFEDRPFFHGGTRAWQDKFDGRRIADAVEKKRKHYEFWDDEKKWIEEASFFFIAWAWGNPCFLAGAYRLLSGRLQTQSANSQHFESSPIFYSISKAI